MKNKYIIPLIIIAVIIASCGKDWLEIEPIAKYTTEEYTNDPDLKGEFDIEKARSAMDGAYMPLGYQQPWGMCTWTSLNSLTSNANCGGGSAGDRKEFEELDNYKLTSSSLAPLHMWQKLYRGIQATNLVLADAQLYDSPELRIIKSEARTLRAYYYFDLVRFFGDVPYVTDLEVNAERIPADEILNDLSKELEENVPNLKDKSADGKINLAAGYTLLGKIYLWQENFIDAAKCFAKVISNTKFELKDDYESIFNYENELNNEIIFNIPYDGSLGFSWDGWSRTSNMEIKLAGIRSLSFFDDDDPLNMVDGWGFIKPTPDIVDAYIAEDDMVRLNANIWFADKTGKAKYAQYFEVALEDIASFDDTYQFEGFFRRKYSAWINMPLTGQEGFEQDFILYRFADVLLLQAECLVNGATDPNGNSADYYVNMVRERVNLPAKSGVTLDDIKTERRLELAFEFDRYFDLIRWGDAELVLGPLGYNSTTLGLYPIPKDQIISSGGVLTQNPGY